MLRAKSDKECQSRSRRYELASLAVLEGVGFYDEDVMRYSRLYRCDLTKVIGIAGEFLARCESVTFMVMGMTCVSEAALRLRVETDFGIIERIFRFSARNCQNIRLFHE